MKIYLFIFTILILSQSSSISSVKSLAVTIYNDQFALVKDVREINFDQGISNLHFTDVSSNIQTQTVTFKALNNTQNITVFQQNFEANLINPTSILHKYINKEIEVYAKLGKQSEKVNGTLLGYNSGYIMKTQKGVEVFNDVQGVLFPSLPEGFFTLPTLNWKVNSATAITTDCEVAYRTSGFSWKSDYLITLYENQANADMGGWVTIDNNSGKKYENAKLKLIAGDVNTVRTKKRKQNIRMERLELYDTISAPTFSQKSFSDYHMYTLSQTVTLNDRSQKQVEFIPKIYNIEVEKYNLISVSTGAHTEDNLKANNQIKIRNVQENQLGIPLPKGTVRVFQADESDGSLQFIGEDSINHTPKNENITLNIGKAFDITAKKVVINYQGSSSSYSANLNLTVANHKNSSAEIVVEFNNHLGDNLRIIWSTTGLHIQTVSATLFRIRRIFQANEEFSFIWRESYRK